MFEDKNETFCSSVPCFLHTFFVVVIECGLSWEKTCYVVA